MLVIGGYFLYPHLPVEQRQQLEEQVAEIVRSLPTSGADGAVGPLRGRVLDALPYASGLVVDGGELIPQGPWIGGKPVSSVGLSLRSMAIDQGSALLRDPSGETVCFGLILTEAAAIPPLPQVLSTAGSGAPLKIWERFHQNYAARFPPVWFFAGKTHASTPLGAGTFLILTDLNREGELRALAWHFPLNHDPHAELPSFFTSIAQIEASTKLHFYPELQFPSAQALKQWTGESLW